MTLGVPHRVPNKTAQIFGVPLLHAQRTGRVDWPPVWDMRRRLARRNPATSQTKAPASWSMSAPACVSREHQELQAS